MPPETPQRPSAQQTPTDPLSVLMEDRYMVAVAIAALTDEWVRSTDERLRIIDKFGARAARALTQATGVA